MSTQQNRPQAGKAFQKVLDADPKTQEALRRAQARLRAFGEAVGAAMPLDDIARRLYVFLQKIRGEAKAAQAEEWQKLQAELDAEQRQYESEWQRETGVVPPRYRTIEELEAAIEWWQKQATLAGFDVNRIAEAGEDVFRLAPMIMGSLILRLEAARAGGMHPGQSPDHSTLSSARLTGARQEATGDAEASDSQLPDRASALSPAKLAEIYGLPREALRKRLGRLRKIDHGCFIEVADRASREAQYLYYVEKVLPVIEDMKGKSASGEMSGKRPARKKPS